MAGWSNPDHMERLKVLHAEGLSASEIMRVLNREFADAQYTRNAVIGKAYRAGFGPIGGGKASAPATSRIRQSPDFRPPKRPRKAAPVLKIAGNDAVFEQAEAQAPRMQPKVDAFAPLPGVPPIPFEARSGNRCRWPVDGFRGPSLLCCGAETEPMANYCAIHTRMSVAPSAPKKASPKAAFHNGGRSKAWAA